MQNRTTLQRAPMTEDAIRHHAPSVFATTAHESRSAKFVPVPSWEIIKQVMAAGFVVVDARQSVTRTPGKGDFTRHIVRLQPATVEYVAIGDTVPEALLTNANDGTSGFRLNAGATRLVCLNGLCVPLPGSMDYSIPHMGKDVAERVIDATFEVVEHSKRILEAPSKWASIELTKDDQLAFAEAARIVRYGDADGNVKTHVTAEMLLDARRVEDRGNDVWRTFNRIQENATKGGLTGFTRDPQTRRRRRATSRAVTGIEQDLKLNKALWLIAEMVAKAKS